MTWCKGKHCSILQKGRQAWYNLQGLKPLYCKTCIPVGMSMVNVVHKKCEKCNKIPSYGYIDETARFCKEHKLDTMINVSAKKCEKCSKQPCFGFVEESARFCTEHKLKGMVNVFKKCETCFKTPTFGYLGEPARFCLDHKLDSMVNVRARKCEKCSKIPNFGYPDERPRFCKEHKLVNMKDIRTSKCEKCSKQCVFGYLGERPRFCVDHKDSDMINIVSRICQGYNTKCPVRTYITRGNNYCMSCDPDDGRRKRFKRYENEFFDYVNGKLDIHKREFHVSFDQTDTSKKFARLDGIVFGDGIIVCIEVDEDGHDNYDCDEHRMHLVNGELLQKYPEHNIAWVRVNPMVPCKEQWSPKAVNIRNKRFDDVIETVNDILITKNTELKYIGF